MPFGDRFCGPASDGSVFESIIRQNGNYEPHVSNELRKLLKPGMTFVDIGANLGYFTVMASRLVGSTGTVIAFEPMNISYNYCKKNIELNSLHNVTLHKIGLWSECKTLKISNSSQLGFNHINDSGESITCATLDSMNIDPDVIKMDIEGAEPFALQGMAKTLKHRPTLILEINRHCLRNFFKLDADAIWDPLVKTGYQMEIISTHQKIKSIEELKRLCKPDDLIELLCH